jgi:hypothetical protein
LIFTLFTHGHRFTFKHLCWHLITKILRNGPKAHFPFNSAWNLPPHRSFFNFVSNPPASDGGLGLRVWPSPEDIEALVAPLRDLPNDER